MNAHRIIVGVAKQLPPLTSATSYRRSANASLVAEALLKLDDHSAAIGRHIVEELVRQRRELRGFPRIVPQLVTVADAEWLKAQPDSDDLVRHFRAFGSTEVRQFLFRNVPAQPADGRLTGRHDEFERKRKGEEDGTTVLLEVLRHSSDPGELLNALFRLDFAKWPDLRDGQRQALATAVNEELRALDLPNRIVWTYGELLDDSTSASGAFESDRSVRIAPG